MQIRGGTGWLLAACCACMPCLAADPGAVSGRVFADANGNGRADAGEAGIPGVAVSDGRTVVRSGADGRYVLRGHGSQPPFMVKPAGWRVALDGQGLPRFWARPRPGGGAVDFALARDPHVAGRDALEVLVIADPQVASPAQVGYFARDVIATTHADDGGRGAGGAVADLGVVLGDIVDDVPALYPQVNAVTASLGIPWLHAAGNHDVDPGRGDAGALRSFGEVYGPDTLAWEEPEAVFVVLDDVVAATAPARGYVGGLREEQFDFLEAYLPTLPPDRLLVLAVHVPLFDTAADGKPETFRGRDRERLFALLERLPRVLVLSGHRHTQRQYRHGEADGWSGDAPLHEFNVGAASGAFWSGIADVAGIPDAVMADGTPNGHARLRVEAGGGYRLSWHPARLPAGDPATTSAMALHAPAVLRHGAYPAWGVYANVYMGEAGTRVEYRIGDGPWRPMQQVLQPDRRLLAENARDDQAGGLRGFDRSPEADASTHLWRGALATDLGPGEHGVEVRAFDPWRGEQRASTRYRLDDAEPPRAPR